MRKRLFIYTTVIIFAGLLSFFAASAYVTSANNISLAKDTVIEITQIYAGLYNADTDISSFVKIESDTRITVIAADGAVLADSRPLNMSTVENHLERPEVQAAANGSPNAFVRRSDSLGIDFIYYALKVESGESYIFIRTAIPVTKIDAYLFASLPLLVIILVIVAVLCFIFMRGIINRVTKPFNSVERKLRLLSNGEYAAESVEPVAGSYEEIDKIVREIDEVALVLQNSFDSLRSEKTKLDYILNNISDGIFAVDENKNITLINASALDIFGVTPDITGKNINYLSYGKAINGAVEDCVNLAKNALFEFVMNGSIYLVTVKRLTDTELTMIVLSDITENRENAKRRGEFFANASHELKTPLTAIKGFNELTAINNKDENIRKFIDSIARETDRMLSLIGDMLKLSELENMQVSKSNSAAVSLAKIVSEVHETMSAAISDKGITFETTGDAVVTAGQEHIYELVKNLIENAVRYTNQNGRVSVTVENEKNNIRLIVSDNGIGIPPDEQIRIFERFYRVEKSRSQKNGGTGLGLSIVKHICALYDWKLSLKSKLGIGTEVIVAFNL
jgi:two-component system phosphate regulon sensor histidine kinase PhoR